jgi:hypothetical protein
MAKNSNFEQFKGPGQAYAPKAVPPRRAPAEMTPAPAPTPGPSDEDAIRAKYRVDSKLKAPNPRAQSTDHMQ